MSKFKLSRNIFIFIIFLVITTLLWLLRALNDNYTAVFHVNINYNELPANLGISTETPTKFSMKVTASARQLRNTKRTFENGIAFSGNKIVRSGNKHYIAPEHLKNIAEKNLPPDVRLIQISPDTLFLHLEEVAFKKVPVMVSTEIDYASMYDSFGDIVAKPDSILVSGSEEILSEIDYVATQNMRLKNVKDTLYRAVSLVQQPGLKYSHNEVAIIIPAEKYTEKSLEIVPEIINLPDTLNFISFPKSARITFRIGMRNFENVSAADFKLVADFKEIIKEGKAVYTPRLLKKPDFVKNVSAWPQSFEYFMEKKKDEEHE